MSQAGSETRYDRQMRFEPIGEEGQARLREGCVVIMGCGAVGSGIAHNLARAGVGRLRLVDGDRVEWSNLPRQTLFSEADARRGVPKAAAAAQRLREMNSEVVVEALVTEVDSRNAVELVAGADATADGLDNMEARLVVNDACVRSRVPWVYGGAVASQGMTMTIVPGEGPCLRCLVEDLPPRGAVATCNELGVINPGPGVVSALESCEVMKLLTGRGRPNTGLLRFDVWEVRFRQSVVARRSDCPACGLGRYDFLEGV